MSDPFQDTPPAFEGEEDPAADFLASQQNQLADLEDGDDFGFNSNTDTGEWALLFFYLEWMEDRKGVGHLTVIVERVWYYYYIHVPAWIAFHAASIS